MAMNPTNKRACLPACLSACLVQMLRFFATHFASTLQPRFLDMARGVRALTAVSDSTRMRLYEALVTLSNGTMDSKNQVCWFLDLLLRCAANCCGGEYVCVGGGGGE